MNLQPNKRRRGISRTWLKVATFSSFAEAERTVEEKGCWKKCSTSNCAEGSKVEYRCTAGRYRIDECPSRVYLLYYCDSLQV